MRIAAISDFHIGATALTDTFGHAEDAFLRWLDRLEARHDRIVLLGGRPASIIAEFTVTGADPAALRSSILGHFGLRAAA